MKNVPMAALLKLLSHKLSDEPAAADKKSFHDFTSILR